MFRDIFRPTFAPLSKVEAYLYNRQMSFYIQVLSVIRMIKHSMEQQML